ncbi:uncharacterized protein LOC119083585 [Bradysia coprophila]|uniref:uncharacterized protein LOC119083585 n=1 Tax=Bradysia coprophila TaxID=38358 RepID=UPI00187D932B|nr:uncharacterized protein LOC119083585 [Bradysia coprophila]
MKRSGKSSREVTANPENQESTSNATTSRPRGRPRKEDKVQRVPITDCSCKSNSLGDEKGIATIPCYNRLFTTFSWDSEHYIEYTIRDLRLQKYGYRSQALINCMKSLWDDNHQSHVERW